MYHSILEDANLYVLLHQVDASTPTSPTRPRRADA